MRWISIKDRLPEEFKDYFVITIYGNIKVDEWRPPLGGSWLGTERITHWMPIPKKPYKGGTE